MPHKNFKKFNILLSTKKLLFGRATSISLHADYGCFALQELSICNGDYIAHNVWNIHYLALYRKSLLLSLPLYLSVGDTGLFRIIFYENNAETNVFWSAHTPRKFPTVMVVYATLHYVMLCRLWIRVPKHRNIYLLITDHYTWPVIKFLYERLTKDSVQCPFTEKREVKTWVHT